MSTRPGKHTKSELENGHGNSGFSHETWWKMVIFHSYVNVYQRVVLEILGAWKCQPKWCFTMTRLNYDPFEASFICGGPCMAVSTVSSSNIVKMTEGGLKLWLEDRNCEHIGKWSPRTIGSTWRNTLYCYLYLLIIYYYDYLVIRAWVTLGQILEYFNLLLSDLLSVVKCTNQL